MPAFCNPNASTCSEAETRRRILAEHLARPDVAPQNATGFVASGFRDRAFGRSVQRGLRCHAGADAVPAIFVAFMPARAAAVLKIAAIESRCRPLAATRP